MKSINFELADFKDKILSVLKFYLIVKSSIINKSLKHNFKDCFLINEFLTVKIDHVDYSISNPECIVVVNDENVKYKIYAKKDGRVEIKEMITTSHKKFLLNTLGLNENSTKEEVKKRYKELANILHPDKGGSNDAFVKMKTNYNLILEMYFNWKPLS